MRQPVPLDKAYRLLNHGPTVIVSAAHGGRHNAMAAAWAMPLDFTPPKVAVVLDKSTFTRSLVEASGTFALGVPCVAIADATYALGSTGGRDDLEKIAHAGLSTFPAQVVEAPLVEGCIAWLECRVIPEPQVQQAYDLFLGEVIAAQADDRVFSNGRWHFDDAAPALRSLHHVAGGAFVTAGPLIQAVPAHRPG